MFSGNVLDWNSYVFDEESEDLVHFDSTTDALIAKLHLENHIPPRFIDSFLDILRNEQFDSAQVSFKKSTDIDKSIADYRFGRSLHRAKYCDLQNSRLPYDIFPLIMEKITQDRLPLRTDDPSSCFGVLSPEQGFPSCIASRLQALALTHRALTPLAQRKLGQRIFMQRAEHLRALRRSPLLGPWTTELIVNMYFSEPTHCTPEEIVDSVVAILRRAPGLQFLRIRTPPYLDLESAPCRQRLLSAVGALAQLETLCWIAPEPSSRHARADIEDICRFTRTMPRLRALVLRNVRCGWVAFDTEAAAQSHQLRALSLSDVTCPVAYSAPSCISWLLGSGSGSSAVTQLTTLSLDLTTNFSELAPELVISPARPHLRVLRLRLARPPPHGFFARIFAPDKDAGALASPQLHTLQLCLERPSAWRVTLLTAENMLAHIPQSVRVLQLVFFHLSSTGIDSEWTRQEEEIARFLETEKESGEAALPLLNALEIKTPVQHWPYRWMRLRAVCEARNCALTMRREGHAGFA
ncbi:hypothetical protein DFH11DRAFT_1084414 [Phellopilus nigrolimitatus]|nr:hypothetical protein DFH11DRAFT_1084414 [Phellopilus nigrolimitatus]